MSRARLHELRALKRRILRAEAGGTPDLASRRAFNAELRASRLALRAGGVEHGGSHITVENLKKALEEALNEAKQTQRTETEMQIIKDEEQQNFLKARLSRTQPSKLVKLSLSLGQTTYHNNDNYHSYQIFITNTRDCSVDIRFSILYKLQGKVKLHILKNGWWRSGSRNLQSDKLKTREKEIHTFLEELNSQMNKNDRIRSKVIDTLVNYPCKIPLGKSTDRVVVFDYDKQSTSGDPVELTLQLQKYNKDKYNNKIKILASEGQLAKIENHESVAW